MKICKWQILSIIIVSTLVFLGSLSGIDNSIRGEYGGKSGFKVLREFNSLAVLLYSAEEIRPNQYAVEVSPTAYFFLPLFWAIFDGILVLLFSFIPHFFARPRKWSTASIGILLSIILVPSILFAVLSFLNEFETFRMFTDFGIHAYHGFGIDLGGALTNSLRVLSWTVFLSVPNVILLIICISKGKDGLLMQRVLRPRQ